MRQRCWNVGQHQHDVMPADVDMGPAADVESDGSVSEADSREWDTEDSWDDETSAAATDPLGMSPDIAAGGLTQAGDSDGSDIYHSPGCSEGES